MQALLGAQIVVSTVAMQSLWRSGILHYVEGTWPIQGFIICPQGLGTECQRTLFIPSTKSGVRHLRW